MEKISFRLDGFEGPLDVILTLISRHKLDIFNIEISELLTQYLDFMAECHENNFELTGEFLEMASRLIYIKTVSLLPQPQTAEELKKDLQSPTPMIMSSDNCWERGICQLCPLPVPQGALGMPLS